jgi:hypothetical protein
MSIHGSVETSWRIRASGNNGARRSGVTGSWVPGCSGGRGWIPAWAIDGMMFSHAAGSWSWDRSNLVGASVIGEASSLLGRERAYPGVRPVSHFEQPALMDRLFGDLDPPVHQARPVDGDGILGRPFEWFARLDVEHAPVTGALHG